MRIHNYEKKSLILYISAILLILEIILFIYLKETKEFQYEKITGYIISKNEILITPTKRIRKMLYKNKKIYIKDHLLSYEIKEDKGVLLESNNKRYYELIIKAKIPSNNNQIIEISIKEDLDKIKGGAAVSIWTGIVIAAIVVFISGVIEGITNPERCHG